MLARSFGRAVVRSLRHARDGPQARISSFAGAFSTPACPIPHSLRSPPPAIGGLLSPPKENRISSCRRNVSSKRPPLGAGEEDDGVDVTPVGNKPGQITKEAIAEAEAAPDLPDDDILEGTPSDWDYEDSTEGQETTGRAASGGEGWEDDDEDEEVNPPTPILDAYERSRDPAEMERLIQMSFDCLPKRAGPQRYNHKRREHQRFKTIRKIKYKEKLQREAAYERKLQKRRDRKARDLALFATWRGTGTSALTTNSKQ